MPDSADAYVQNHIIAVWTPYLRRILLPEECYQRFFTVGKIPEFHCKLISIPILMLIFADDVLVTVDTEDKLQLALYEFSQACIYYKLKICTTKSKTGWHSVAGIQ